MSLAAVSCGLPVMPNAKGVWTPRGSTQSFPKRVKPFKARAYQPPQALPAPKRTLTELDESSTAELLAQVSIWLEEANRLEAAQEPEPEKTLEDRVAELMFKVDVPRE